MNLKHWDTNPFALAWKKKLDEREVEHDEDNEYCLMNRCGEWAKCNNYECEGEHECTCQ